MNIDRSSAHLIGQHTISSWFQESLQMSTRTHSSSVLQPVENFSATYTRGLLPSLTTLKLASVKIWLIGSWSKLSPSLSLTFHPSSHLMISLSVLFNPWYHLQLLHISEQHSVCQFCCLKHSAYSSRPVHMCGYKRTRRAVQNSKY